jgi:hypothetical protein
LLNNNPDYIDPVREVEEMLINELCPNPDQMTYEQLLEFQEKIGYVEKGFTKKEIEVKANWDLKCFFKIKFLFLFLILIFDFRNFRK